ncbi:MULTISPECIES: glycosyltransferase [unclassified Paenibacillus]|uniref:glycosyltransferase n=1 Tax=unclassified Paenibacillus TaxID=185978 RepID=UPI0024054129|nr:MULTISPECIES: glycosyltransferase [unclassified Paenibacillus]MDF9840205.1 glycosyltransferase involved in cell wall biosynthesis [Paenibacillus sp. PastF-2]MDF9846787.1 glycosyltransferase involved in cell wall biosynthesis [Paenibacillus sp. PastM-2]MDF9852864.1 glycosyltransferase involved in cell wall biosynthesis [Paenibacillus sp. PastF-1]MDH6478631.1 glycosyltransferase involved in cell wall biosynthesis [Paenibacillus sp. PastH-2]MDH6505871.1 glycosyltransferase involved in cell wal
MSSAKSFLFKKLYKSAVKFKPVAIRMFPFETRQRIKQKLLKVAFPIDKNDKTSCITGELSGVNLVGYSRAEMGIGESCRIAAKSMEAVDIPFGIINFIGTNSASMNDDSWIHKEINEPQFNLNIFHINAEQMIEVYAHYGNSIFKDRYNIGFWHWELPDFPDEWQESFNLVDEIWAPSTFVVDSIAQKSPVPVVKIPHSIKVSISDQRDRSYFNLPEDAFLFLSMYDLKSYQARKNPQASIIAFQLAFKPEDKSVGLVIKVNSAGQGSKELDELHQLIGTYTNIYLVDKTLSRNDTNALLSVIDSYVSLHRSEGFGLGLAEAMYLGKPVIGTNWSSNIDFMDFNTSCLVNYSLVKLNENHGPYKEYQYWAEPDVEHASTYMRTLFDDKNFYKQISSNGEEHIKKYYSPQAVGDIIQRRLKYISMWKFGGLK